MDAAYNSPNRKKKFILFGIGVLVLFMIGIIIFIVNSDDEEDPAPAPAPAPSPEPGPEPAPAPAPEPGDEYNDDGNISDFTPNSSICGDSDNEYVNASECKDITSGKKCGDGDGKGGRWVRRNENSTKKLCKWKNNECVYHKDCGSNTYVGDENKYTDTDKEFCQRMIDEKGVIPIGVDGEQAKTGTMTDSEKSSWREKTCNYMYKDKVIQYPPVDEEPGSEEGGENCINDLETIKLLLDNVTITSDTIPDVTRNEKRRYDTKIETIRDRKNFRDDLRKIVDQNDGRLNGKNGWASKDQCDIFKYEAYEALLEKIVDDIENFNELFNTEIEETSKDNDIKDDDKDIDIYYYKINWPFQDVTTVEDLLNVLNGIESFKNYEPYHNGNPRSSRKVPKPYDEHFVNFRSY